MRNRYVFIADVLITALAVWAAYGIRFGFLFIQFRTEFWFFMAAALLIKPATFYLFGLYRRYWRYAGYWDIVAVFLANCAASIVLMLVMYGLLMTPQPGAIPPRGFITGLSRSVLALDWLLTLSMTFGCRASVRAVAETMQVLPRQHLSPAKHVLIVGAGDAGALVAREMQKNPQLGLRPIGFLDDARDKAHQQIHDVPVLGNIASMLAVAASRRVDEVVIAIPTAGGRTVRSVAERCQALGIPSRVMPGFYELLDGQVNVSRLRSVDITDLLRRPQVMAQANPPAYLEGACVVVTGAGGSIGSELCRQVAHAKPSRLLLLGHGENSLFDIAGELRARFPSMPVQVCLADVRDRERIMRIFREAQPGVVFHAAAHKHVPLMEENAAEAVTNNIVGTRNVAEAAVAAGVQQFVLVSTDKAVAPSNLMGASKRVAELIVQRIAREQGGAFVVVRFGNVLGSRGSVVPLFKAQIERGGPVTVTHPEVRRYFMTIPESVHLILQAGGIGQGGELFVLDMGEPVLLREMAADMIRLSGFDENEVPIVFTELRPGEKLNELLWEAGAVVEPTTRGDVRRVVEPAVVADDVLDSIVEKLVAAAAADDHQRIVRLFHECLPSAALASKRPSPPRTPGVVVQLPRA
jgi:FlaA1/EpsC-like NDP-sugar epimerase